MEKRPEAIIIPTRGLRDHPVFRREYRHAVDLDRKRYSFFVRADVGERLPTDVYEIRQVKRLPPES